MNLIEYAKQCKNIINCPESNIDKIKLLLKETEDVHLVSIYKVFKNILPLYRIKIEESKVKDKKEYILASEYELKLVKNYKVFIQRLMSSKSLVSFKISSDVLNNFSHFNFTSTILTKVIRGASLPGDVGYFCSESLVNEVKKDCNGTFTFKIMVELMEFKACKKAYEVLKEIKVIENISPDSFSSIEKPVKNNNNNKDNSKDVRSKKDSDGNNNNKDNNSKKGKKEKCSSDKEGKSHNSNKDNNNGSGGGRKSVLKEMGGKGSLTDDGVRSKSFKKNMHKMSKNYLVNASRKDKKNFIQEKKVNKTIDRNEKEDLMIENTKVLKSIVDNMLRVCFMIIIDDRFDLYEYASFCLSKYKRFIRNEFKEGLIIMLQEKMKSKCDLQRVEYNQKKAKIVPRKSHSSNEQPECDLKRLKSDIEKPESALIRPKFSIEQSKCDIQRSKSSVEKPECDIQRSKSSIKKPECDIQRSKSSIEQPKSALARSVSSIEQPESALKRSDSSIEQSKGVLKRPNSRIEQSKGSALTRPKSSIEQSRCALTRPESSIEQSRCDLARLYSSQCFLKVFEESKMDLKCVMECLFSILKPLDISFNDEQIDLIVISLEMIFLRQKEIKENVMLILQRLFMFISLQNQNKIFKITKRIVQNYKIDVYDFEIIKNGKFNVENDSFKETKHFPFYISNAFYKFIME